MILRWFHDPDAQNTLVDALCWVVVAAAIWNLRYAVFYPLTLAFGV